MRMIVLAAAAALLGGCATTPITETKWRTVTTVVRGPCPDEATYAKLTASRPTPLRNQARPGTGVERSARTAAQLGLYEAPGKWADQVAATLARCQVTSEESKESEGVADAP